MFPRRLRSVAFLTVLTSVAWGGCGDARIDWNFFGKRDAAPEDAAAPTSRPARDPVLAETIGDASVLGGLEGQRVQGYGLVVGLGENGGGGAPTAVREYLIDYFTKEVLEKLPGRSVEGFSAEQLIDSADSAVVEVVGMVPAGACKGTLFDVQVTALPGTQTRSLEGGVLLPCELKNAPPGVPPSEVMATRTLGRAGGPVFTNPFSAHGGAADPLRGTVLGGGRNSEPRTVRLILAETSYALARRMEQRINERFGQRPKSAEAVSKAAVVLHTPSRYLGQADRFIQLATHLYVQNQPAYVQNRLRELAANVVKPGASREGIALIWEGIGRPAIPELQPFFTHSDPGVRYYAARAALRLRDSTALAVVADIARSAGHPHRVAAIRELGECYFPQAAADLAPLLSIDDQEVRIAAYEALLQLRHSSIESRRFDCMLDTSQLNFVLDVVDCGGRPLIYVRRSRVPRITVFGANLPVEIPIFYVHPQEWVTLNARSARDDLMVMSRPPLSRARTLQTTVPPRAADLIAALGDLPVKNDAGRLGGVGLTYAQVVNIIDELCREGAIPARLVLEQTPLVDILGPAAPRERREADESAPPPAEERGAAEPSLAPRPPPDERLEAGRP